MPGMFGAIGCPVVCSDRLQQGFAEVWQSAETLSAGDGIIGGHTYQPGRSVFRSSGGVCFAVDGDVDIYEFSAAHADAPSPQLWRHGPSGLTLEIPSAGNAAIADEESGAWTLLMDGSGAFPLYYSTAAGATTGRSVGFSQVRCSSINHATGCSRFVRPASCGPRRAMTGPNRPMKRPTSSGTSLGRLPRERRTLASAR